MIVSEPRPKRRRLNFACNYCRSRKTRCDEQKPSCHACVVAGVPCITVNLRRPGSEVERREAGERGDPSPEPTPPTGQTLQQGVEVDATAGHHHERISTTSTPGTNDSPRFQGPLPLLRQRHARNRVETLVAWLDLAIYRLGQPQISKLSEFLKPNLRQQLSFQLPRPPNPPPRENCDKLLLAYFDTVNLLHPFLELERSREALSFLNDYGAEGLCEKYDAATLMQLYLALILGSYSSNSILSKIEFDELESYCKTLQGHIIHNINIETVRATALVALNLKYQGSDTAAWATLAQSSSLAESTCVNVVPLTIKKIPALSSLTPEEKVWWSLYCFEKTFALELGHSSQLSRICDPDISRDSVVASISSANSVQGKAFVIIASLAVVMGEIGTRCIRASLRETICVDPSSKVKTTGECCLLLSQWAEDIPPEYSPVSDLFHDKTSHVLQNFVAMQYNNAIMMLARNSLLISEEAIQHAIEVVAEGQPWEHIIRHGQLISAKAARNVLMMVIEGADNQLATFFPILPFALHAAFILYIRTVRHPRARVATTDRALIYNIINHATESRTAMSYANHSIYGALEGLRRMMDQIPSTANSQNLSNSEESSIPFRTELGSEDTTQIADITWGINQRHGVNSSGISGLQNEPAMDVDGVSPQLPDQIGWDWALFSQLFPVYDPSHDE